MGVATNIEHPAAAEHPRIASSTESIGLDSVRTRLAFVWLGGAGAVVVIMVLQSLLGRFGSSTQQAWGWLLPTIVPTLGMIMTVLGYTALDPKFSDTVVRKDYFRISELLSIVYLALVLLTVLIGPFAAPNGPKMVDLMQTSNLWLGPFQGLVASALGVLFVQKKQDQKEG